MHNENSKWYKDQKGRPYYLGDFLRMEDRRLEQIVKATKLSTSPEYSCYRVFAADRQLEKTHKQYAHFNISELRHNANLDNFMAICKEDKITPGEPREIGNMGSYRLSWWGLWFNPELGNCLSYKQGMSELFKQRGEPSLENIRLLRSSPFYTFSRYGNYRISLNLSTLLRFYKDSIQERSELRIGWTGVYQWQFMHTILVIPQGMSGVFEELPLLYDYTKKASYPVVEARGENDLIWCPQSTSTRYPKSIANEDPDKPKHWDNLTFAFVIPEGCDGIDISDEALTYINNMIVDPMSTTRPSPKYKGKLTWREALGDLKQKVLSERDSISPSKLKKIQERLDFLEKNHGRSGKGELGDEVEPTDVAEPADEDEFPM